MPLKPMPMAPGTRPDKKFETVYQPSRGGHYPKPQTPVPGKPKA
ncbi:hypothetical protein [Streptomyces malaysiensis]|nr:hypothetical protein [Streptomyces samsunensis]MCQ6250899.1 hypothetical protein [Streptomyces malaysiensis]